MDCHKFLYLARFGIVGVPFCAPIVVVTCVIEIKVKVDFVGNTGLNDMTCFVVSQLPFLSVIED